MLPRRVAMIALAAAGTILLGMVGISLGIAILLAQVL